MDHNSKIFKNKSLSDLFAEIYDNSRKKEKKITELIDELQPLIKEKGDAVMLIPLLKGYIEQGIKNDEHLIKLAAIIQRVMPEDNKDVELSEKDLDDLYNTAKNINIKIEKQ